MAKLAFAGDIEATGGVLRGSQSVIGIDPGGTETLRVGGGARFSGNAVVGGVLSVVSAEFSTSTGTPKPFLKYVGLGLQIALGATFDFPLGGAGSVLCQFFDANTGSQALIQLGSGAATILGGSAGFSTTSGNPGTINIFLFGSNIRIQNNRGSALDLRINPLFA